MPLPYEGISPVLEALAKEIALTHPRLMPDDWWPELITITATHHVDGWEKPVGIQACVDAFLNDFDPEDSRARAHEFQLRAIRLAMWQALEDRRLHPEKHKPQAIDGDGISGHVWNGPRDACARCSVTRKEFEDNLVPKVCVGDSSWRDDLLTDALRERNALREEVAAWKRENKMFRTVVDAHSMWSHPLGIRRYPGLPKVTGMKADRIIIDDPHKPERIGSMPRKGRLGGTGPQVFKEPDPATDAYVRIGLERAAERAEKQRQSDAKESERVQAKENEAKALGRAVDFDWSALRALRKGAGY